jgi:hypothetical protein
VRTTSKRHFSYLFVSASSSPPPLSPRAQGTRRRPPVSSRRLTTPAAPPPSPLPALLGESPPPSSTLPGATPSAPSSTWSRPRRGEAIGELPAAAPPRWGAPHASAWRGLSSCLWSLDRAGAMRLWTENGPCTVHRFNQFSKLFLNLKFPEIR